MNCIFLTQYTVEWRWAVANKNFQNFLNAWVSDSYLFHKKLIKFSPPLQIFLI